MAPAEDEPRQEPEGDRPGQGRERQEKSDDQRKSEGGKDGQDGESRGKPPTRRRWLLAAGALVLIVAAPAGYLYWDHTSHFELTDDAFIAARQFSIAPQVAGYVVGVPVTDNQHVDKDSVIARIDPRNYRRGSRAGPGAGRGRRGRRTEQRRADRRAGGADRLQPGAGDAGAGEPRVRAGAGGPLPGARSHGRRHRRERPAIRLAAEPAAGGARLREGDARARRAPDRHAEGAARQRRGQSPAGGGAARPGRAQPVLHHRQGRPARPGREPHGRRRRSTRPWEPRSPCSCPTTSGWSRTSRRRSSTTCGPASRSTIGIDAYPERVLHGHVASIQPGSGTAFSLLPAENATGNYVKIVQRVPVKIVFDDIRRRT